MTTSLVDYPDLDISWIPPELLPPITATMTWVFQQVDESIVADVNENEDCIDSPMHRHNNQNRHLLLWNLVSGEEG